MLMADCRESAQIKKSLNQKVTKSKSH